MSRYFLHLLWSDFQSPSAKPYEHTRSNAEDAIRQFIASPLHEVVDFFSTEQAPLVGIISDDEAFFSVLLRFACGESSVAVAQNYSAVPEAVLGYLSVYDLLAWLDEDFMLLKGNESSSVATFPQFLYTPAQLDSESAGTSVCEGLLDMKSRGLASLLVNRNEEKGVLSATSFRDLFSTSFAALSDGEPLLLALSKITAILPTACIVSPHTSIAMVVRELIDKHTSRVIIQREDGVIIGTVRATDIFQLLLRAQHTSLRS